MATKNEIFNKLVEDNILLDDVKISDFTKNELIGLSQDDKEVVEKKIVIEEEPVIVKEEPVHIDEESIIVEKFLEHEIDIPKSRFELSDNFKPVYRINGFKKGSDPVIKISPDVYEYIKSNIHIDDISNTSVDKQLKSIVYHIRKQPSKYITVSSKPDQLVRCYLANDTLMSYVV